VTRITYDIKIVISLITFLSWYFWLWLHNSSLNIL